jgi:protein-L-isoaspartate(D-aspartate) O-methyltransferase
VPGARDRQELGQALDHPHDGGLDEQQKVQAVLPGAQKAPILAAGQTRAGLRETPGGGDARGGENGGPDHRTDRSAPAMNIEQARFNMIEQQIRPWEVLDQGVLSLLSIVKREDFVPPAYRSMAFVDTQVPLPHGQSMLEPKVEARLLQELAVQRHERVLEIGAGSGYMAALLAHKAQHVTTVEIDPELARMASENLKRAWVLNARVIEADASAGLVVDGPFDVIVLSGSVAEVPRALLSQLKPGGRLAAIVGQLPVMRAVLMTRGDDPGHSTVELFDTVAPRLIGFGEPSRFVF